MLWTKFHFAIKMTETFLDELYELGLGFNFIHQSNDKSSGKTISWKKNCKVESHTVTKRSPTMSNYVALVKEYKWQNWLTKYAQMLKVCLVSQSHAQIYQNAD